MFRSRRFASIGFTIFLLLICGPWAFCQSDWAVDGSGPFFGEFNSPLCPRSGLTSKLRAADPP